MLFALVLACALPATLGFGLLIQHFYTRERAQVERDSLFVVRSMMQAVDRDLDLGIIAARALAMSAELDQGDLAGFHRKAVNIVNAGFPGSNIVLSTRDSVQLLNTLRPFGQQIPDPGSRERIQRVFETGQVVVSDVFIGGVTGKPLVAVHVPVIRGGQVVYCLSVGYQPGNLGRVLASATLPRDRVLAIFDRKGVIIARTHEPERFVGKPGSDAVVKRLGETDEAVFESTTLEGIPVYTIFTRSSRSGWAVAVGVPRATILQELLASVTWLTWIVLALLLAGFGLAWFISGKIRQLESLIHERTDQLEDANVRISTVVDSVGEGIITIDEQGRIETFNRAASEIFGYSAQEVVGAGIQMLMPESIRAAHQHGMRRFLSGGEPHVIGKGAVELPALRKDGTLFTVELSISAIRDEGKYRFVGVLRDVTELKKSQEALREAVNEAQAANAAKSSFLANMSHELRTPMNAVLGMAHLMTTTPLSLEQRRYLTMLRTSGQSLLALLNDILDFSKIEAGKVQFNTIRFELDAVLHAVSTIMSVNAGEKELELVIGVEPDVPRMLLGDPLRLQQVLVNLTSNAIKFTARGEVSLKVECAECDQQRSVMRFIVCDTGIGISAEQTANLFAPFAQADESVTRKFGGTGLGLVICQRLVELQGGSIALESRPGEGSTFTVTLPFGAVPAGQQQAPSGAGARPLRVLVLDDHFTSRVYLSKTLQAWGWGVDIASSGAEAEKMLALAAQRALPYDVILADWSVPGDDRRYIDGLREPQGPRVPVILMVSAYERSKMLEEDADRKGLLTKPITASALYDTVHEVLDKGGLHEVQADAAPALRISGRLLLVEDNAMNQLVAVGILERAGATIDVAGNGEEAVRILRASPEAYRLVLMDVQMPVMDGYTATRIIRQKLGLKLPIVAMTAGVMESERADCLAAGMDDFIPKPLDIDEMMQTLERYLPP
ncbi:response regulator [Pseudoduganella sp. S-14]|jgi:PAS domain S-box-containing protein|uniref:response regulator n=1 Tax=Pseudoduganella sp. S-14 TaxID=3404065 RepID=UPI003CE843F7